MRKRIEKNNKKNSPLFLVALFNFLIIILITIYMIYLRFVPYTTIVYDGYAISGKEISNNLLDTTFDADEYIDAIEVRDQDNIYQNLKSFYIGASKEKNINLNYPIYVNDQLALYNLSSNTILINDNLNMFEGYPNFTLTAGALYNSNTLERADYYNYILMKNQEGLYINTKEMKFNTSTNKYTIKMNSIINFTDEFITYYTLEDGKFVYNKIIDIDNHSLVKIEDFNKKYTYKEFLIGLGILAEDKKEEEKTEENIVEEEKEDKEETKEETKEEIKEENNVVVNEIPENIVQEETTNPEDGVVEPNDGPVKWQKPTVSCTDFVPNVYTALTQISISDPSAAINKAVTFAFYRKGELSFRTSATSSGSFKVTNLIPNTTYNVIGTFQYTTPKGEVFEAKFLDQEFKTMNTDNIKSIELQMKKGQVYSNKIEILDLGIVSDITEEAIYGVSKARIFINNTEYLMSTGMLRNILNGKLQKYQSDENLESSTKYKYEIKFYDTAGNEMDLKNNTGSTVTSKAEPSVKVKVTNQKITSLELKIDLTNKDNVELSNYRYVIYTSKGEIYKKDKLTIDTTKLLLNDFNPEETYTIRIYADFDIDDGKGYRQDVQIGRATFTTVSLERLGSLKLKIKCNEKEDITSNKIKFNTINKGTDNRLINILNKVDIKVHDEEGKIKYSNTITDINQLTIENGVESIVNGLESNTTYYINITAEAQQGNTIEQIKTSYTFLSFKTRKQRATMEIKNIVESYSFIDFDLMVLDVDGASTNGKYIVDLRDFADNLIERKEISKDKKIRCTYEDLDQEKTYKLKVYAQKYNETNNDKYIEYNNIIGEEIQFYTDYLGADIDLIDLIREKGEDGKNIIDVESYNSWYSKCFDVKDGSTKRNYGKTFDGTTLKLTSNQYYVYDFSNYIGKKVTMSFYAKISDKSIKDTTYLQLGKNDDSRREKITGLSTSYGNKYTYTITIPNDGYVGFYIEGNGKQTLDIQKLQVELGEKATDYEVYKYNLKANMKIDFEDTKQITFDEKEKYQYDIRLKSNGTVREQENYQIDDNKITDEKETLEMNDIENGKHEIQIVAKYEISEQEIREYILDEISFNYDSDTCKEIKGIKNKDEFIEIQPNGNYIILEDLDLTEASTESQYTFGNENIGFYGSVDFNGKTITKDVYSNGKDSTSYIFYNIEKNATIKNIVIDFKIDNENKRIDINEIDGIYSLFLYNKGNIDNLMLNLKECSSTEKKYIGLIGYKNEGKIENFVIDLDTNLYGSEYISGCSLYSSGTIQNGYMYGSENNEKTHYTINAIGEIIGGTDSSRNIGGIVYSLDGGVFQNVYNLAGIKIGHWRNSNSLAANLIYKVEKDANVRNVYSVNDFEITYGNTTYNKLLSYDNKTQLNNGLNIYNNLGNVQFSYYFSGTTYENNECNAKQDLTLLNDWNFQDNILNANNYNQFEIEKYVKNGYYPQIKLNGCMPRQDRIKMEEAEDNEIMDILNSNTITYDEFEDILYNSFDDINKEEKIKEILNDIDKDNENVQIAVFNIYNPSGRTISEINIDFLNTNIKHQTYEKKISRVYVILSDPTTYINEYNITSVVGTTLSTEKKVTFGENGDLEKRTIKATFVKYINSEQEWDAIDEDDENGVSGLVQNYKLVKDLDFEGTEYLPAITGAFTGTLDGQEHTIYNINTDSFVFESTTSKIKNLRIDGLNVKYSGTAWAYIGFVGQLKGKAIIDNVHIKQMNIKIINDVKGSVGGISGEISGGACTIQNCSVSGFSFDFKGTKDQMVGGIGGFLRNSANGTIITNCYVQGININISTTKQGGTGGVLGNVEYGPQQLTIQYCYTEGKINNNTPRVGGIAGYISYGNNTIQYCYSLVDITGTMTADNMSVSIGGICGEKSGGGQIWFIRNNFYIGNIRIASKDPSNVNRIVGNSTGTSSYKNYGYETQIIKEGVSTNLLGATKLFTRNEILTDEIYSEKYLDFGNNYNYLGLSSGQLPQLCYNNRTDENGNKVLLPNQSEIEFESQLEINDLTYEYNNNKDGINATITYSFYGDLNNIEDAIFTNIEIDGMEIEKESINIDKTNIDSRKVKVSFSAKPVKFYNLYTLNIYNKDDINKDKPIYYINIFKSFYKQIWNVEDWNSISDDFENYKLMADINFADVNDIKTEVKMGEFIGDKDGNGMPKYTISGYEGSESLINTITYGIKDINFKNITIKATKDNLGIITNLNAYMTNCHFDTITIDAAGKGSYIGIVSKGNSGSSMTNITINKVDINGNSKVGGLCGEIISKGDKTDITGTYISVTGTSSNCGGIFGSSNGGIIKNVKSYQYSSQGRLENDEETAHLVKGTGTVGGVVGSGLSTMSYLEVKYSTIIGGTSTAGVIGYTHSNSATYITSSNNKIIASGQNVGGCIGYCGSGNNNLTSTNNTISKISKEKILNYVGGCIGFDSYTSSGKNFTSENNVIEGTSYVGGFAGILTSHTTGQVYVGGLTIENTKMGSHIIENMEVYNNTITASGDYVGGVTGCTNGRIRNVAIKGGSISGKNYVGGAVGAQTYNTTNTGNEYYSMNGIYVKDLTINGSNYVGGVSGFETGVVYAAAVDNSTIKATGKNAGGISGYYTGSTINNTVTNACETYFILHSFCANSTITAGDNAGGIIGEFLYGNIEYCYVGNTSVIATNNNAGGIVGYLNNENMTDNQYKATIKYNYIANEVNKRIVSSDVTGGILGAIQVGSKTVITGQDNDGNDIFVTYGLRNGWISNNLVVTNIEGERYISSGIGQVIEDDINGKSSGTNLSEKMNNIYVYGGNYLIKGDSSNMIGADKVESQSYTIVDSEDLNNEYTYFNENKLGFGDSNGRFTYKEGYFPTLTVLVGTTTQTYWGSDKLNVIQNQIQIPKGYQYDGENTATNLNYSLLTSRLAVSQELPDIYVYPVDVDKINIEFSEITPYTYFKIEAEDGTIVLEKTDIQEKVYTLKYDFNTLLTIKLENLHYSDTEEVDPQKVQNLLDIINDEYLYLTDNTLNSSKRKIDGKYLNIYDGKALSFDGNIYDISTMSILHQLDDKIEVLEEAIPIIETTYEGTTVKTYYHCSKIIDGQNSIYKDQQIFIKNNEVYLADGDLDSIGDSIIIDSYNNKQYQTVLGTDGIIYNLMTDVKYPNQFKNENILDMTNNLDSNSNIILVYYSSGNVCAFNYITGEEIYNNQIKEKVSLANYILNSFTFSDKMYDINEVSYEENQELIEKLEKVSIEQAVEEIAGNEIEMDLYLEENNDKYITTYNAKTQNYETYNIAEVFKPTSSDTISENEKIKKDSNLNIYYSEMSSSKVKLINIGTTIFIAIISLICIILIAMYRKNNK